MIVKSLLLKNFRNHNYLSYDFEKGINVLTGPNGAGKTNIIEAIYFLSLARSFRLLEDEGLIEHGKDKAEIEAIIVEGEIKRKIRIIIKNDGKQVIINGKPISKLSELAKVTNVILFEPKDVLLFKGSPKNRRSFLDISLSKHSTPYMEYISRYEKVLKERNEILKQDKIDHILLDANTEMLIKLSGPIVSYRQMYVKDINDILIKITHALAGTRDKIEIIYKPFVPYDNEFISHANEAFKRALDTDIKRKATTIGIHREDFSVNLNDKDIGEYGSQGENRLVSLALKLSPYFLIEDKDKRPIVALDDVMSELDETHQQRLIKFLKKFEQVFITATKLEISESSHYTLKKKEKEVF